MKIQFERPYFLLLLIPVIAGLIFSYRFQNEKNKHVKIKQTILAGVMFSLLILAMSKVELMASSDRVATVFVVDTSASVSDYREEMKQFINDALQTKSSRDYVGVVAFGGDAQVEQFVSEMSSFKGVQCEVNKNASNLEQAVTMAASLIPEGTFGRIILMTDGVENEGTLSKLSGTTLLSEKELLIYQINPEDNPEVFVTGIDVGNGNQVSKGDKINILVKINSNQKTEAKVHLYQGRTLVDSREITLSKGENQVLFTEKAEEEGLATYTVRVEAVNDTLVVNNEYSTYLNITREKKYLVVEDAASATDFVSLLNSLFDDGKQHVDLVSVRAVPKNIAELMEYTAVIFVDVYEKNVPAEFMAILKSYVRDNGGGFIATGGHKSFGMGGYKDTVLEEILPVEMEPVEKDELPSIAICYVIDKSGSMAGGLGMADKLEIAKKATAESIGTLIPGKDYVGIISFDDSFTRVVKSRKIEDRADLELIQNKAKSIQIEGGTNIKPALEAAVQDLAECDAKIKHIILLTDGEDGVPFSDYKTLLTAAGEENITISTVAVGEGCNLELLKDIATAGQGSCYSVGVNDDLPKIFTQEILLHRKSYVRNVDFVPSKRFSSLKILDGVDFSKDFKAYIATKLKENASELAYYHDEEDQLDLPILAVWQYGLGKTVAWMSDVTGEWSQNYSGSTAFAKMWGSILAYVSTYEAGSDVYAKVEVSGDNANVIYHTEKGAASSRVEMTITDSEGREQIITLNPTSTKDYKASFKMDQPGAYLVSVKRYEDGVLVSEDVANTVAMMQYSEEYVIDHEAGDKVLKEFMSLTGATNISQASEAFKYVMRQSRGMKDITPFILVFAMVFFLYTIFYRRFRLELIPEGAIGRFFSRIFSLVGKAAGKTAKVSGEVVRRTVADEDKHSESERGAEPDKKPDKKSVKKEEKSGRAKPDNKQNEVLDTSQLLKRMKK